VNRGPLDLVVDAGATARLTRLITRDKITAPLRDWAMRTERGRTTYLVNCPYCVSVWAGLLVASGLVPERVRWALALSEAVAVMTHQEVL
jgi:hypothetical protein